MRLPQPSSAGPHWMFCAAHVVGLHVGFSGATQEPRSKIMNSSNFSCGVMAPPGHSFGKATPLSRPMPVVTASTWKSSKSTLPHCEVPASADMETGVLNV